MNNDEDAGFPEAQHRPIAPGKKAVTRDYEPRVQDIFARAFTLYKTCIMSETAYPDKMQEKTWAKAAWRRAAQELHVELKPDSRAIDLVRPTAYRRNNALLVAGCR